MRYLVKDIKCSTNSDDVVLVDSTVNMIVNNESIGEYSIGFAYDTKELILPPEQDDTYPLYRALEAVGAMYANGNKDFGKQFVGHYVDEFTDRVEEVMRVYDEN